ncbi:hypothetical protein, partial [Corynebacterium glutamicum]|uniref:hypothetical protein n=1 Tax=Corynebacterium glutamicum TaxID=1718 RepID=UPI000A91C00D
EICFLIKSSVSTIRGSGPSDGYIELAWAPGVAQVDFGQGRSNHRRPAFDAAHVGRNVPVFECALCPGLLLGTAILKHRGDNREAVW